ncbi:MAG: PQQ-binding-like beta-propeller repeat protein [Alphaproteobacteria bacterium]|nr:PQQ-binding-like beta-propeller repeat protein [Alphaproteobacteria bacterium]
MHSKTKFFGLICFLSALCACSSHKEVLKGERISVLDDQAHFAVQSEKSEASFNISSPLENETWTQTGSNASHKMQNFLAGKDMTEIWSSSFGEGSSKRNLLLSRPVVSKDKIYAQDVNATVYAFDLKTGKQLFKQKLKTINKNDSASGLNGVGLALENDRLYALAGFGSVFALDADSGKILWRKDLKVPLRTAPTVASGKLFIQTIDNQFLALNTTDGSEIWAYNISSEDTVLAGLAPSAYNFEKEIVVAAFSNGEIKAFNARIGYPLWSNTLINTKQITSQIGLNAIKAAPVIDGDIVFSAGTSDLTIAANIETGEILWQIPISSASTPCVDKDALFILSENFELTALNKKTGKILWSEELLTDLTSKQKRGLYLSGPVLINSELMVTSSDGMVYTFDPKSGKQKSILNLHEDIPFSPIVAQKKVIFTTSDAELIVFE